MELNKNLIQDNCSPKVFEGKIDYQPIDLNYFTTVSDLELALKTILEYYKNRFQIEFLYRDSKQFAALNHCQARSKKTA